MNWKPVHISSWWCLAGAMTVVVGCGGDPDARPTLSFGASEPTGMPNEGALIFELSGEPATFCGVVGGFRVEVTDPLGTPLVCAQPVTPIPSGGVIGGPEVPAPECGFTGPTGRWAIDAVEAFDPEGRTLRCCSADLPPVAMVTADGPARVGAVMTCSGQRGDLFVTGFSLPPEAPAAPTTGSSAGSGDPATSPVDSSGEANGSTDAPPSNGEPAAEADPERPDDETPGKGETKKKKKNDKDEDSDSDSDDD